jgi:hypothetical protein
LQKSINLKFMKPKYSVFIILAYTSMYFAFFTPRMHEYTIRADPREDWAVAKPVLRWIEFPTSLKYYSSGTSKFEKILTFFYTPLISFDSYINKNKYNWKHGQHVPSWAKDLYGNDQ